MIDLPPHGHSAVASSPGETPSPFAHFQHVPGCHGVARQVHEVSSPCPASLYDTASLTLDPQVKQLYNLTQNLYLLS